MITALLHACLRNNSLATFLQHKWSHQICCFICCETIFSCDRVSWQWWALFLFVILFFESVHNSVWRIGLCRVYRYITQAACVSQPLVVEPPVVSRSAYAQWHLLACVFGNMTRIYKEDFWLCFGETRGNNVLLTSVCWCTERTRSTLCVCVTWACVVWFFANTQSVSVTCTLPAVLLLFFCLSLSTFEMILF